MNALKTITLIVTLCCSLSVLLQESKVLNPEIGETFDFSAEVEAKWQKRDKLLDDINKGKKKWDSLSVEDKELLEKYPEVISGMWDVIGGGCSWYCGAGEYSVKTSSQLASNGEIKYESSNLNDFSYETAWVEGKQGYGIGESITFSFIPEHPRVTEIIIANGYIKSKTAWRNNSRVHQLKMYVNKEPFAIIDLKDVYAKQIVKLKKPLGCHRELGEDPYEMCKELPNWSITFEIISVYKGDKYDDTAITEIFFDGLDVH